MMFDSIDYRPSIHVDWKLGISWNVYTVENTSQVDQE